MSKEERKLTDKEIVYELSKNDKKFLRLVKVASKVVLKEDEELLKELAKH